MVELWRNFWIRETGTGQEVAQLHEIYKIIIIIIIYSFLWEKKYYLKVYLCPLNQSDTIQKFHSRHVCYF